MGDGRRVTSCVLRCRLWVVYASFHPVLVGNLSASRFAVAKGESQNSARHGEREEKRKKETTRLLDDGGAPHFRERLIVRGRYKTLCATTAEMEWRVNPLSYIISDFKLMAIVTTTD